MTLHPVVGLIVVIAFIGAIFVLMLMPVKIDQGTMGLVNTFLGVLAGMATAVVQYYFGSSSSSRAKDDTIAAAVTGSGNGVVVAPKQENKPRAVP